jgi:hypothetical protein
VTELTKIAFQHRRIRQLDDVTDLVEVLFPGNRNQQHAAARILLFLRQEDLPQRTLADLERRHAISRRTLQRTRAKLARLGLIEHASGLCSRHGGQEGWMLSGRMSTALRHLADRIDQWRGEDRPDKQEKERILAGVLAAQIRRPRPAGGADRGSANATSSAATPDANFSAAVDQGSGHLRAAGHACPRRDQIHHSRMARDPAHWAP